MSSSPASVLATQIFNTIMEPPAQFISTPGTRRKRDITELVDMFVVQCCECHKWRTIPTKDEFETIRENLTEDPWFCSRKRGCSCDDPADIEYDSSRIWLLDMPNIPKPPPNTERLVTMRSDLANMDICYVLPGGKYAKCLRDVQDFLNDNPEYKESISVESFNFTVPRVVSDSPKWRAKKAKKQGRKNAPVGKK
ncbi:unnamed protein product [Alopecurus aequalis]